MMLGAINTRLYAQVINQSIAAIPADLTPEDLQRTRSMLCHRLANAAQRFAHEVRSLERGASPDEACDAFDEMERLVRESFPVLRAARGEAGL